MVSVRCKFQANSSPSTTIQQHHYSAYNPVLHPLTCCQNHDALGLLARWVNFYVDAKYFLSPGILTLYNHKVHVLDRFRSCIWPLNIDLKDLCDQIKLIKIAIQTVAMNRSPTRKQDLKSIALGNKFFQQRAWKGTMSSKREHSLMPLISDV